MAVIVHTSVRLGNMQAQYLLDEQTLQLGLRLIPAGMEPLSWDTKRHGVDSCVQAYVTGDVFSNGYAGGKTLRQSGTTRALQLERIQVQPLDGGGKRVEAFLRHPVYGQFCHCLDWHGGSWLESHTTYHNDTARPVCLEALTSVSLFDMTPFSPADAPGDLVIHRLESAWSMEGRLLSQGAEELNLEPSWAKFGVRTLRFGQVGSMPVNGWFPWLMVEDRRSRVFWGCQIAHNASWQLELYRADDGLAFSGGLADYQFGHWRKTIQPGETFRTPEAILTVCRGKGVLDAAQRMTASLMPENPVEEERDLPIVFNEYCTSWGCPSQEGISQILEVLRGKPIRYFVIDAGWYKPEDKPWDQALGDWKVSQELFPQGLEQMVKAIRQAGMIPGIWFEPETVGPDAQAYHQEDHLLKRDGFPITTMTRRFWDFRDPWVIGYVKSHIVDFLKDYGFGYVKLDYNDTIGLGCDGGESLGEGLRQHMEQVAAFHRQLHQTLPELVVENCASGGHRLEPSWLRSTAMSSFSDAHECAAIPIIAANLHYALLPRQSQIWAVLRQEDTPRRIVYTMAAAFLGRMCLSGDVTRLSPQQWQLVDEGMAFYRRIAPVIAQGHSHRFGPEITAYNTPAGWQGVFRMAPDGKAFAVLHQFGGDVPKEITIPLPTGYRWRVMGTYGNGTVLGEKTLTWHPEGTFCAAAAAMEGEKVLPGQIDDMGERT